MISEFKQIGPGTVQALLRQHWGLAAQISELPSYADKNFRVRNGAQEFVAKLANPGWNYDDLDFENQALMHLQSKQLTLQLPRVKLSIDEQHLLIVPVSWHGSMQSSYMRLLSFIPGDTYLSLARQFRQQNNQQALARLEISLGQCVAQVARGLADFTHSRAERPHAWNLLSVANLRPGLVNVIDPILQQQLNEILSLFERELLPIVHELPMQVVHNDANDLNLIVSHGEVTGLIDFGDMCHSLRIADLAIAITYALQFSFDVRTSLLRITLAYLQICHLQEKELHVLWTCILARLSQSVLLATQAAIEQPENSFAQVSQTAVRNMLNEFIQMDRVGLQRDLKQLLNS